MLISPPLTPNTSTYKPFDEVEFFTLEEWEKQYKDVRVVRRWNAALGLEKVLRYPDRTDTYPTRVPYRLKSGCRDIIEADKKFIELCNKDEIYYAFRK